MYETGSYVWSLIKTALRFKEVASAPTAAQVSANTIALYAKDKAGVSDLYFKDDAGVEHDIGLLPPSGQALTRTDDTNVTLTLGGSPTVALLAATSLTLGWTGQLAAARGGTGVATLGDLTKVDDTNVTLTLGGAPTGALITSTSLTLGWTGQLAASRGGTGKSVLEDVTAGSTKITLGGTPTGAVVNAFSVDVNQANLDHGSIGGLTDDDHTQYALLAGRSGGQTLSGSVSSGSPLEISALNDQGTRPVALRITSAFVGTASGVAGLGIEVSHVPTASVAIRRGMGVFPTFNPDTGVTISSGRAIEFTSFTGSKAGTITELVNLLSGSPTYGSIKPTTAIGIQASNVGTAGVTTAIGIKILDQNGATNNFTFELPATSDTPTVTWTALGTNPPSTAPAGYIKTLIGGATRYIPFWA